MRSINLKPYDVVVGIGENGKEIKKPYDVSNSLVNIMFAPSSQVTGRDVVRTGLLAKHIEEASKKSGTVLLEEEEWNRLKSSVEAFKGFGRNDVELVQRVIEAEKVEVTADRKDSKK